MSFWDVKDGPVVIDIPPADTGSIAGNIVNLWQMPLEDAGPEGADKGKGGKYVIFPPGYKGKAAARRHSVLQSDTFSGFALLRSNLASHSDARHREVGHLRQTDQDLSAWLRQRRRTSSTCTTRCTTPRYNYDASFFRSLDRVVQNEPWLQRDRQ